jgi:hypothetical protein
MERRAEASPQGRARLAGAIYFFSVFTAVLGESLLHGRLNYAAGFVAIAGMVAVTLLLCGLLLPVSRNLVWLAALLNLGCLTLEALRWQPGGVNLAMGLHGVYCLLAGSLIFRSTFLSRTQGVLMGLAGVTWLIYLSPPLSRVLSPWVELLGLLAEGAVFLWLLVKGVNVERWRFQTGSERERGV